MTTLQYFITSKAKRNLLKFFLTDINASYYTREAARLTGEPLNAVRRELGYLEKAGLLRSYMQGNLKYYEIIRSFPFLAEWRRIVLETTDFVIESPGIVIAPPDPVVASEAKQSVKPSPVVAVSQSRGQEARQEAEQPAEPEPAVALPDLIMAPPDPVIAGAAKRSPESEQSHTPHPRSILTLESVKIQLQNKFNNVDAITLAIIHGEAARSEKIPEDGIELLVVGDINKDSVLELIADLEVTTGIDFNLMHLTSSDFDYRNAQGDPFIRRIWGEKKLVIKGRH